MAGYDFLNGIRVLEVAQLGPSSLGGYLADMGAEVIKVEGRDGDPVRVTSTPAVGSPQGPSFLHLRWNRGKKSIGLDLKNAEGAELFRRLAADSDVVIEGMRAGVLDRLGLGYDDLRKLNPRIVFCSISGLGRSGPYHTLGSHGPSFDAFGGLSALNPYGLSPEERERTDFAPIGMHAMGLNAALGTLAAVIRAQRTGKGALIEVTGAESAAHWLPEGVDKQLNASLLHERPGFFNSAKRMAGWSRLFAYETRDGRRIFFQGLFPRFWKRFCALIDRPDLVTLTDSGEDSAKIDEIMRGELQAIFITRTRDEWMDLFRKHDVPGGPVNTMKDLASDPHFVGRGNIYEVEQPGVGKLRLSSTPVKTLDQGFAPTLAPGQWQDSQEVLRERLGLQAAEIERLRLSGAVYIGELEGEA